MKLAVEHLDINISLVQDSIEDAAELFWTLNKYYPWYGCVWTRNSLGTTIKIDSVPEVTAWSAAHAGNCAVSPQTIPYLIDKDPGLIGEETSIKVARDFNKSWIILIQLAHTACIILKSAIICIVLIKKGRWYEAIY